MSFEQILKAKMQETPPVIAEAPVSPDPAGLAFLLGKVDKFHFRQPSKYPRPAQRPPPRPQVKVRTPGPTHVLDESQKTAFDYFGATAFPLIVDFKEEELKHGFRKLALLTHPDRGGSAASFMDLKRHYEILKPLFASKI